MAEESKLEDDLDSWLGEDADSWINAVSSSANTQAMIENVAAQRELERARVRLDADLTEFYLNPLVDQIVNTEQWASAITQEFAHSFLELDENEQLHMIKEALKDPKGIGITRRIFQNWLDQFHPDHEENISLDSLGWQPHRRMPEYIRETVENHLRPQVVLPALNTRDDLLPLFSSNLSQDLIRDENLRQEPDERVVREYGLQGISVEALSVEDYDLPKGQEVGISKTYSTYGLDNMFTIPEGSPAHQNEVIVHARKLPIYNIPVEDRLEMDLQEQLQANDNQFITSHNDGSVDAQVANSYEDALRYANWEVISEVGVGENETPILYANYEGARMRERNERIARRQARDRLERLQLEEAMEFRRQHPEAMAFVRRNEPDNWRRF